MIAVFMCVCGACLIADRCAVAKDRYDQMAEQGCIESSPAGVDKEAV